MYNVHMTRFTASEARRELFRILDSVEQGEEVILERRGTRFKLILDPGQKQRDLPTNQLKVDDPVVLSGEWTWAVGDDGHFGFRGRGSSN